MLLLFSVLGVYTYYHEKAHESICKRYGEVSDKGFNYVNCIGGNKELQSWNDIIGYNLFGVVYAILVMPFIYVFLKN